MLTLTVYLKIFGKIILSKLLTQNTLKLILLFINQIFFFPVIKINYSNKYDREFFEVSYNNKRKVFSNLSSLNIWLNNYFFSKPKI